MAIHSRSAVPARVRPFTAGDLPAAARLAAGVADPAVEPFGERLPALFASSRALPALWSAAEREGELCGLSFALLRDERCAEIYGVVAASARRQGLGRRLIAPALDWARAPGSSLRSSARDPRGDAFLAGLGFTSAGASLLLSRAPASLRTDSPTGCTIRAHDAGAGGARALWRSLSDAIFSGEMESRLDDLEADELLLVASLDGAPAGFLRGRALAGAPRAASAIAIEELGVLPSARRRGLARALCAAALSGAAPAALAWVQESNAAARALYAGLGFAAQARRTSWTWRA